MRSSERRLVLVWNRPSPVSSFRPIRFEAAPGPELLRQNVDWLDVVGDPSSAEIERIARTSSRSVYALFDLETMPSAIAAVRRFRGRASVTAVRGRVVPDDAIDVFGRLWLDAGLLSLLRHDGLADVPESWRHPVLQAECWRHGDRNERLAVVFTRPPEPGVLDLQDFGRAGVREGSVAASTTEARGTPATYAVQDLRRLLGELEGGSLEGCLLIDNGGDAEEIATELHERGVLRAYFAPARRAVPPAATADDVLLYRWLEPEDFQSFDRCRVPAGRWACAYLPVGIGGEDPDRDVERVRSLRELGFAAVVPRFHLPIPNTSEWVAPAKKPHQAAIAWRLRRSLAENRWPRARSASPPAPASYSLAAVRSVLDGYVGRVRAAGDERHGRDFIGDVLREIEGGELDPWPSYPFLAWREESLLAIVDRAIAARLRSLRGVPSSLSEAMRHTALAGGKRIRPVLAIAIAVGKGAPLDAAVSAALAVEWLHTASLVQDDLPCMDDDSSRRGSPAAHVRHGEGLALLASDALVALAFEDLAALAEHRAVGPKRATAMVGAVARALGGAGTVGGQAIDLASKERGTSDLRSVIELHRRKTAPLFRLAAALGAILADVEPAERRRLEDALGELGVAFQIVDDLLDADGSVRGRRAITLARRFAEPTARIDARHPIRAALANLAGFVVSRSA